ncbi:hypothetical protein [Mycolicibacterium sphagni]|uniref:hypothetical protein n=1 Tax=Mycolicibacterium sphagni TaxID=1786 RepID=UPI0021F3192C|nr:hypothetical protein [Mycolicibacterium sphagni]MCV7174809.1 hypothetical protein [Mycolicibacterium sphagni]
MSWIVMPDGSWLLRPEFQHAAEGMGSPVLCGKCGKVYDLQAVHVTQRYADCSMWRTPCCDREADDRPWKGDYTPIPQHNDEDYP